MPSVATNAVPSYPTAKTSAPLRVFTAGNYGPDDDWTIDKLQQVVANWDKHQKPKDPAWAEPPAVFLDAKAVDGIAKPPDIGIGHEADQAYLRWLLDRTDMPAAGWPTDLWLDGDALYATLDGVPEEVASLINGGLLPYCSAEFHRDYTDRDGNHYGPALRRISLIGAEPPRSKGNGRTPPMIYSENPADGATSRLHLVSCFSESSMQDRQTMLASLAGYGVDMTKITDVIPDEAIAELLRAFTACKAEQEPPPPPTPNPNPDATVFTEPDPTADKDKTAAVFTERKIAAAVKAATAPLAAQLQTVTAQLAGMGRQVAKATSAATAGIRERERSEIASFCERMVKEGRLEPSRLDPRVGPTEIDIIVGLGSDIATFGERKVSPRQAYIDQIAARQPIRTFSERMADPIAAGRGVSDTRVTELLGESRLGQIALKRR